MGEKAVTRNPTGNSVEHSWIRLTSVNPRLNRRQCEQANAGLILLWGSPTGEPGLPKTGKGTESGSYQTDLDASSRNPAESGNLSPAPNEN